MRKGERRKAEFLSVAAELFSSKGFADTSVQDILDRVGCSKGSFYHHFLSKHQLLEELIRARVRAGFEAYEAEDLAPGVARLDRLLYYSNPLRQGEENFIASLLSLSERVDSALMQLQLKETTKQAFYAELLSVLASLSEQGLASHQRDAMAELLFDGQLSFAFVLMEEWARILRSGGTPASRMVELLRANRLYWERMLDLPYGSLNILQAKELLGVLEAAQARLQSPQAQLRFDAGYAAPCQQLGKPI